MIRTWTELSDQIWYSIINKHFKTAIVIDFNSAINDKCNECDLVDRCAKCQLLTGIIVELSKSYAVLLVSDMIELKAYIAELDKLCDSVSAIIGRGSFYKPYIRAWQLYTTTMITTTEFSSVIHCGDDDSDVLFARNISANHITSEKFFDKNSLEYSEQTGGYVLTHTKGPNHLKAAIKTISFLREPCFVMMIGAPCSGKTFAAKKLKEAKPGYSIIEDYVNDPNKTLVMALKAKEPVVANQDNNTFEGRSQLAKMARSYNYNSIVFWYLQTPEETRDHLFHAQVQLEGLLTTFEEYKARCEEFCKVFEEPTSGEAEKLDALLIKTPFVLDEYAPKEVTTFQYKKDV